MESKMSRLTLALRQLANDESLGPQYLDQFDFTLKFESVLFNIVPAAILIVVCPFYLAKFRGQPVVAPQGALLWFKLVIGAVLALLELTRTVLWGLLPAYRTEASLAGTALLTIAAVCIVAMLFFEYRHDTQSSTILSLYLTISILLDAAQSRSFLLRSDEMHSIGIITAVMAGVKFTLILLGEIPKRLNPDIEKHGKLNFEATGGFWNRTLMVWLNSTLFFGFRNRLTMGHLERLGPEFSSRRLMDQFDPVWAKSDKTSSHVLMKATLRTLVWPILAAVLPRVMRTIFSFIGPFLIQRILINLDETDAPYYTQGGLIAATALVYLGFGLSSLCYIYLINRTATFIRGVLIGQVIKKNLSLTSSVAKRSAALTLMSADVDGIIDNTLEVHSLWMSFFEVGFTLYFLSTFIGNAWFLPAIPIILTCVIAYQIAVRNVPAVKAWNASIDRRVSKMATVLSQIRGIKMMGLESVVGHHMQDLRVEEIDAAAKARRLRVFQVSLFPISYWGMPILIVVGCLYWTTMKDGLTPKIFTVLAFVLLLDEPMATLLNLWPEVGGIIACFKRLQEFLLLPEQQDPRERTDASADAPVSQEKEAVGTTKSCVSFQNVTISAEDSGIDLLKDINLSIDPGTLVSVVGPVGAGKSVLLNSLLGETRVSQGKIRVAKGSIAYCDQKAWLPDSTIREVIVGECEFDQEWFDKVIRACALDHDLNQLPEGDRTTTGTNGSILSGGQKQRVAAARAVYSRAPIVVLDDVFSSLDRNTAELLFSRLLSPSGLLKAHGRTTILATHSVQFLHESDQIIVVDKNGTITVNTAEAGEQATAQDTEEPLPSNSKEQDEVQQTELDDVAEELHLAKQEESSEGDLSLYSYFLGSLSWWLLLVFIVAIATVSFMEILPLIYIRIWIGVDGTNKTYLAGLIALGAICVVINGVAAWIFMIVAMPKIGLSLHKTFLECVMRATIPFLTSTSNGNLLNRFSQDMTLLSQDMPMAFYRLLYVFFVVVTNTALIAAGAKYAGLLLPFVIILLYYLQLFYLRTSRQMRILDLEAKTPLYTKLSETSAGLEHIRAFGWQEKVLAESLELLDDSQRPFYYMYCIQRWLTLVLQIFAAIVATILVAIALNWKETATQPGLGVALISCLDYSSLLGRFIARWVTIETSLGAVARLRTFVRTTPTEEDQADAQMPPPEWPQKGQVEFKDVVVKYSKSSTAQIALDKVTLTAEAGKKTAICGRTGSGKSTAVLVLLHGVEYTGSVTIDGIEISSIPRDHLRSMITTITQDPIEIPGTLQDNLWPFEMFSNKTAVPDNQDTIRSVLDRVGLAEHVESRGGLQASMEDMNFSYGQRQLLSVARAMLHHIKTGSKIVILDEATSSMDQETEKLVFQQLEEAFNDCTRLIISHREAGYADSDAMVTLENGKVKNNAASEANSEKVDI